MIAGQCPGHNEPEYCVDGSGDQSRSEAEADRRDDTRVRCKPPECRPAHIHRFYDQAKQRQEHDRAEPEQRLAESETKTGQLACPAPAQKGGHRRLLPWTIDLIEDAAIVEVLGLRGLPAAEHLIHGEQWQRWKFILIPLHYGSKTRPVVIFRR